MPFGRMMLLVRGSHVDTCTVSCMVKCSGAHTWQVVMKFIVDSCRDGDAYTCVNAIAPI